MTLINVKYNSNSVNVDEIPESLKIKEITLSTGDIGFSPDEREYTVKLDSKTDTLLIKAVLYDSDSSYTVLGNKDLHEGLNEIVIKVEASNGETNQYLLHTIVGEYVTEADQTEQVSADELIQQTLAAAQQSREDMFDNISEIVGTAQQRFYNNKEFYTTCGLFGCGILAIIFWILFAVKRVSYKRKKKADENDY